MKILVINCGSSSIKYKLFNMSTKEVMAQGGVEKIGIPGSFLKYTKKNGEKAIIEKDMPDHSDGIELIFKVLTDPTEGCIKSLNEVDAVGHRILHGGDKFTESCIVNSVVKEQIRACFPLGPLHNPANLKGIMAVEALLPNCPQVAVFDTAFHQSMPKESFLYAIPYELYEKDKVRRYGFHGTSHRYVSKRAFEVLGMKPEGTRIYRFRRTAEPAEAPPEGVPAGTPEAWRSENGRFSAGRRALFPVRGGRRPADPRRVFPGAVHGEQGAGDADRHGLELFYQAMDSLQAPARRRNGFRRKGH